MEEPPSEDELIQAMTEFYQRIQAEPRPTGRPEPFEIKTSVQTLHATPPPPRVVEDPKQPHQGDVKVGFDDKFDFVQLGIAANIPGKYVLLQFGMRCHTPGRVGPPCYIRVGVNNVWEAAPTPAAGPMPIVFDKSIYTPTTLASHRTAPVNMYCILQGLPKSDLPAFPKRGSAHGSFWLQNQRTGQDYSLITMVPGPFWEWQSFTYGAGFLFYFNF
jgi:hypothetical protein